MKSIIKRALIVLTIASAILGAALLSSDRSGAQSSGAVGQSLEPLGYQQVTSIGSAKSLTVPAGANVAIFTVEAQAIRWRDDGTDPTASVGMPVAVGVTVVYTGTLSKMRVIEQTSGGIVNVSYYRVSG